MAADPRQPGMPWLTPYLTVRDPKKSLAFYKKAFGFESMGVVKDKGQIVHAGMSYKKLCVLMMSPEGAFGSLSKTPKTLKVKPSEAHYVYVDDVDKTYANAMKAGARSVMKPEDAYWGDRHAAVDDPDGYRWALAKKLPKSRVPKQK
ncbi:MAG: glyoxalase/bleomycin resistance/extradiol dioxygenase family protein [Rhodospirillaceae bacterium]|nr:glyoxalase/bleomycin resistance/extradiol dioxygenase family protein [Rhodospirillaceae bacterium]